MTLRPITSSIADCKHRMLLASVTGNPQKSCFQVKNFRLSALCAGLLLFMIFFAPQANAQFANDQPLPASGRLMADKNISNYSTTLMENRVFVKWTSSEKEEDCIYVVERSVNANDFLAVGVKEGISSSIELFYSWIDKEPPTGYVYYRIKKISKTGENYYSQVNSIFNTDPGPNPTAKAD